MNSIMPIILGTAAPGIWGCDTIPVGSADLVRDRNWYPIVVDLTGTHTKEELLGVIAKAGEFPDYFGHNWDGIADCLNDLAWLNAKGYVVLVKNGSSLSDCCPDATAILLDVLSEASEAWSERGLVFTTVWEGWLPSGFPALDQL